MPEWSEWKPICWFWYLFGWRLYREQVYCHVGGCFVNKEWLDKNGNLYKDYI
jgi:hypothetical protein